VYAGSREPTLAPEIGALAGVGAVLLLFVIVRGIEDLLGWSLTLAGGAYAIALFVHGSSIDEAAPLVGCALLLCGELATWSLDARWRIRADAGLVAARALAIAGLTLAGLAAAALVVALGATSLGSGLAWTMLGCAAAVLVVAIAARLSTSFGRVRDVRPE
jgi:hypothetical protein